MEATPRVLRSERNYNTRTPLVHRQEQSPPSPSLTTYPNASTSQGIPFLKEEDPGMPQAYYPPSDEDVTYIVILQMKARTSVEDDTILGGQW